ncbi:glyoxalase [Actinocatenispora sera]|uniref:Glyoxalase n=2 Tax=Actinocatenispora sera TaxID=390989 RepID=A0A810KXZ2_9ACTN|nr:glyoxalase [Actinocatenispora sera]
MSDMRMIIQEIMIDCLRPADLSQFWADLLRCRRGVLSDRLAVVAAEPLRLSFQQVPEPKQVKNRLHLDIQVPDAVEAIARATALGAHTAGRRRLDDGGDGYVVMLDPEGNEFCFVVDNAGEWEQRTADALAGSATE